MNLEHLRDWQKAALRKFEELSKENFLVVATPGAGKTKFSLTLCRYLAERSEISQVVIVCPSERLKGQWAKEATPFNLHIDPEWTNDKQMLARDYQGAAVTYQQVSMGVGADKMRKLISQKPTMVIFDEIHHCGENKTWGDSLYYAFEHATCRLLLSGTPFRSDNNQIAFVQYEDKISKADYRYTYSEALHDGVCRPVFFPTYEGEMQWLSFDGNIETATFSEPLSERKARERLRTALSPTTQWLPEVLKEAHARLLQVRQNGHDNAAGLVIAKDKDSAEEIGQMLARISGQPSIIAHYDNPQASLNIENFAKPDNNAMWIVAVKMVSEGVDIPRLRVVVYASNITSELFFRQAVGRVVRVQAELEEQNAYFYIPHDAELVQYVKAIKEERDHVLEEEWLEDIEDQEDRREREPRQEALFMTITAMAQKGNTYFDNETISPQELAEAEMFGRNMGVLTAGTPAELIARILKRARFEFQPRAEGAASEAEPLHEKKAKLKTHINNMVKSYAGKTGIHWKDIHGEWLKMGGTKQDNAELEELKSKRDWIAGKLKGLRNGA